MLVRDIDHKGPFRINGKEYEMRIYIPERIKNKTVACYGLTGNVMVVRTLEII